jgi:hypothetical protein
LRLLFREHILRAGISGDGAGRYAGRCLVGHLTGCLADNVPPLFCSLWSVCLECELVCHGESTTNLALGHVLALDVELLTVDGTDDAVGNVERQFGDWVLSEVVVCLELVEELGGSDDIVVCVVGAHDLALLLERAGYEWLGGAVVLVGEADVGDIASRG